jgi:hypothetical protein
MRKMRKTKALQDGQDEAHLPCPAKLPHTRAGPDFFQAKRLDTEGSAKNRWFLLIVSRNSLAMKKGKDR